MTAVDDIPDAYIHEAGCDPWGPPCRVCLVQALAALVLAARYPQPALPEGETTRWRTYTHRHEVRGPWPAVEARIRNELLHTGTWYFPPADPGSFWPTSNPDEVMWHHPDGQWARVRVTVEVLDGLP